jgi:hypothetical protein
MGDFLLAGPNLPFVGALVLMVLIGAVELAGLGGAFEGDFDGDGDIDWAALAWLNAGRLPLLMLLVVFLMSFALVGLIGQRVVLGVTGRLLPVLAAAPMALIGGLALTRLGSRLLARVLPRDETTAVSRDALVGRTGVITTGVATAGSPAQARVRDGFGQSHYVMVEPAEPEATLAQGAGVKLTRRLGHIYQAILEPAHALSGPTQEPRL